MQYSAFYFLLYYYFSRSIITVSIIIISVQDKMLRESYRYIPSFLWIFLYQERFYIKKDRSYHELNWALTAKVVSRP